MTRDEALEHVRKIVTKRREELMITAFEIVACLEEAKLPKDEIRYRLDNALYAIRQETYPGLNIIKEYVSGIDILEDTDDGI